MEKVNIKEAFFKNNNEYKKIGGQAIIEGVMMRGPNSCAMAVRKASGEIEIVDMEMKPESAKSKIEKLPIIRGVISFVDSLITGTRTLMKSAEISGADLEDEQPSKFEIYLTQKFGEKKIITAMIYFSVVIALLLSVGLFMVLPTAVGHLFTPLLTDAASGEANMWALSLMEGLVRMAIFLAYIYLVSKYKDIQRVFQYHGAEHKTINCFEAGEELTVENVKGHTRIHKRCGTSFLFIVMAISMIVFLFVQTDVFWERLLSRVLLVPVIAGVSYEFLKFAGKSGSKFVYALSFPGLCLQRATTKEPDEGQIETAIAAVQRVLKRENEGDKAPNEAAPIETEVTPPEVTAVES
ncbi:MAG: DUF1385 domain-containing protein [Clostridiales bacterium]|jgi:uncharacterized protein YqhQ|nr:DUF1385 domain-containing protein [Clostridiales bacterium]